jgi:hypothetical protein
MHRRRCEFIGATANSPMQHMHDEQQHQQRGYENDHAFPCIHAR